MVMSHVFYSDMKHEIEVENPGKTLDDVCYRIKGKREVEIQKDFRDRISQFFS